MNKEEKEIMSPKTIYGTFAVIFPEYVLYDHTYKQVSKNAIQVHTEVPFGEEKKKLTCIFKLNNGNVVKPWEAAVLPGHVNIGSIERSKGNDDA